MKTKKRVFFVEHTDLYDGECNYCFLNRFAVLASSMRGAASVLSRESGLRHRFDGIKYVSLSGCTAFYEVEWELTEDQQKAFVPVNFERSN